MKAKTTGSRFVTSLKASLIIMLFAFSSTVYAEYYMVYPEPEQNIVEYYGFPHHHYWVVHHGYFYPGCCCCMHHIHYWVEHPVHKWVIKRPHHWVLHHHRHHAYGFRVYRERCYDPDMATGDDDQCIYPGMDIDN